MSTTTEPAPKPATFVSVEERQLAVRLSAMKVALAVGNIILVAVDNTVPLAATSAAAFEAFASAGIFLIWALISHFALLYRWVPFERFAATVPYLDIIFAAQLILSTDGYLSPFNLWLVFAVAWTAIAFRRGRVYLVAGFALAVQILIAMMPQEQFIDQATFVSRAAFHASFAVVVAYLGAVMATQAKALATLNELGRRLTRSRTVEEATISTAEALQAVVGGQVDIELEGVEPVRVGKSEGLGAVHSLPVVASGIEGECSIRAAEPLGADRLRLAEAAVERMTSALRRIRSSEAAIESAAREERLKLADELHDSHLQIYAAVDMHVELARRRLKDDQAPVQEELEAIRALIRNAAARTRTFIDDSAHTEVPGPASLEALVKERWKGNWRFHAEPDLPLSEGQWRSIEMLLREGMNNALRHGSAKSVEIAIRPCGELVEAVLESDGTSPAPEPTLGYGLRRLKTVVESNQGRIYLEPRAPEGARLVALFERGQRKD